MTKSIQMQRPMPRPIIIGIDVDSTITISTSHDKDGNLLMGKMRKGADVVIRRLYQQGYIISIITGRTRSQEILDFDLFMSEHNIPFHYFNSNPPWLPWVAEKGIDPRKCYADIMIDDKNLGGLPEDWETIYSIIQSDIEKIKASAKTSLQEKLDKVLGTLRRTESKEK